MVVPKIHILCLAKMSTGQLLEYIVGAWYWFRKVGSSDWEPAQYDGKNWKTISDHLCSGDIGDMIPVPKHLTHKPCPFCGWTDLEESNGLSQIICLHCGAVGPVRLFAKSFLESWNTRMKFER